MKQFNFKIKGNLKVKDGLDSKMLKEFTVRPYHILSEPNVFHAILIIGLQRLLLDRRQRKPTDQVGLPHGVEDLNSTSPEKIMYNYYNNCISVSEEKPTIDHETKNRGDAINITSDFTKIIKNQTEVL